MILKADQWKDYSCLDAGNGEMPLSILHYPLSMNYPPAEVVTIFCLGAGIAFFSARAMV